MINRKNKIIFLGLIVLACLTFLKGCANTTNNLPCDRNVHAHCFARAKYCPKCYAALINKENIGPKEFL